MVYSHSLHVDILLLNVSLDGNNRHWRRAFSHYVSTLCVRASYIIKSYADTREFHKSFSIHYYSVALVSEQCGGD